MNCREFEDSIGAFMDGELEPSQLHEFDAHRRKCSLCAMLADTVTDNHSTLAAFPEVEPPAGLHDRILEASRKRRFSPASLFRALFQPEWFTLPSRRRFAMGMVGFLFVIAMGYNVFFSSSARSLDPSGGSSPILDDMSNRVMNRFVAVYEGAVDTWEAVAGFTEKAKAYLETKWEQVKGIFSPREKRKSNGLQEERRDNNKSGMERYIPCGSSALSGMAS